MAGTTLDELVVKLSADVDELQKGMTSATQAVSDATAKMDGALKSFSGSSGESMGFFAKAAETALGVFEGEALLEGVKKLGELLKEVFVDTAVESVAAAEKQQDAVTRLNVALAGAGNYSKEASEGLQEFAHSIQQATKYSEEDVLASAGLIESLTKLDKDGLQRATGAAVNLAAILGKDLNTASMLIGRAAEGNTTQLSRLGFQFQEGSTAAETFKNILSEIASRGDVAAQQSQTYSGAVAQLSHAWEDAHKQLGDAVTSNQAVVDAMKEAAKIAGELAEYIEKNKQTIKEWVAEGVMLAIAALQTFAGSLDYTLRAGVIAFEGVRGAAYAMATGLIVSIDGPIAAISGLLALIPGIGKSFEAVRDRAIKSMSDAAAETNKSAAAIDAAIAGPTAGYKTASVALDQMQAAAVKGFAAVKSGADSSLAPVNAHTKSIKELSDAMKALGDEGAKIAAQDAKSTPQAKYAADVKALQAANAQKKISNEQYLSAVKVEQDKLKAANDSERESEIAELQKKNDLMYSINSRKYAEEIAANKKKLSTLLTQEEAGSVAALNVEKKQTEEEQKEWKSRLQAGTDSLNNLAVFQNSKSAELAAIGKASAVAAALIHTYSAAAAALAPPPIGAGPLLGPILAVTTVAAGLAQVAQIEGVGLQSGMTSVPGIGSADQYPSMLAPNERVVTSKQNEDLTGFLSGKGPMMDMLKGLHSKMDGMGGQGGDTVIHIDGREIARVTRDQSRSGRRISA